MEVSKIVILMSDTYIENARYLKLTVTHYSSTYRLPGLMHICVKMALLPHYAQPVTPGRQ
jgi:hypothetical protein